MTRDDLVPVGPGLAGSDGEASSDGSSGEVPLDEASGATGEEGPGPASGQRVAGVSVADVEALLFVAERPLSRGEIRALCCMGVDDMDELLGDLEMQLRERGIRLVSSGDRVQLATAPESGALIARYVGADGLRLSPAALETLAIVAYRQPVTRGVIERIRGVDSDHVVRGLLHRRLIVEQGRADTPGRPILYGTGLEFMERFGLTSLDDLPPLAAEVAGRLADAARLEPAADMDAGDREPDGAA